MIKNTRKPRWFFPTNTNNIRMILAQGLITSPSGFSKYYQDILEDFDGFLPLFKNNVPKKHIEKACSEQTYLTPCLLELELNGISGQVWVKKTNEDEYAQAPLDANTIAGTDDIDMILIPLPLPISYIKKVIFQKKEEMGDFKKEVAIRSNVFLTGLKLQSTLADAKLFQEAKNTSPQLDLDRKKEFNGDKSSPSTYSTQPNYSLIYAYGGMLALLFYGSKNGAESDGYFQMFTEKGATLNSDSKHRIPNLIYNFFYHDVDESKSEVKIIKGIIDCCLKPADFKDSIIKFLEDDSWGHDLANRREELAQKLQAYATCSPQAASELFHEAKTDIEKLLLMLFTREDSASFIEYNNDKISIEEHEYVLFALFFGIRDGFVKTPPMIRKYKSLQTYISYKMAEYAHQTMDSEISFSAIQPPHTVWQFVGNNISKPALKLLKVTSCVQTIMPRASFIHDNGKNVYDEYLEPQYKLLGKKYFAEIYKKTIDDTMYNKLK